VNNPDCGVIIVAAGRGERMGGHPPKQFRLLGGIPVFEWSLKFFASQPRVSHIALVVPPSQGIELKVSLRKSAYATRAIVVSGGERRQDSVENGMRALPSSCALIAVHDAARPFPPLDFDAVCVAAKEFGAALFACPLSDTVKRGNEQAFAVETLDRTTLWAAQTPQVFQRELLARALDYCREHAIDVTDDAAAVALLGTPAKLLMGNRWNIKLTNPDDWFVAEALALQEHSRRQFHTGVQEAS